MTLYRHHVSAGYLYDSVMDGKDPYVILDTICPYPLLQDTLKSQNKSLTSSLVRRLQHVCLCLSVCLSVCLSLSLAGNKL